MKRSLSPVYLILILGCCAFLLIACGGGSGNGSSADTTSISGSVFAAAIDGASVTVKNVAGDVIAGPVLTAADGTYTIDIPTSRLADDLRFEASGGTFTDEATGTTGVSAGELTAFIPGESLTTDSPVHLDPASTIVHGMVTAADGVPLAQANIYFYNAFGFTPDPSITPLVEAPTATNLPQRLAALRAAAFSYLTEDCGLTPDQQFALLAALSKDLVDGNLNGKDADLVAIPIDSDTNLPTDTHYKYSGALRNCGTATPDLGLSPTSVQTASYKVDFIPSEEEGTKQGKTTFTIQVTNVSDDSPVTGKTLTLTPIMHMSNKVHASPVDPVITDNNDGTYTCTIYYLMMSGPTMGFWELQVGVDGETATFYPEVGMAMGTASVKLYGVNDKLSDIAGAAPALRTYLLFKDGVGANTFNLFIAARDDAQMLSFPAVSGNSILHDETGAAVIVDPATTSVTVSTDNVNYFPATDNGNGHWSATNAELSLGAGATVRVKLTVNNEAKTDVAGTLSYATFTLP